MLRAQTPAQRRTNGASNRLGEPVTFPPCPRCGSEVVLWNRRGLCAVCRRAEPHAVIAVDLSAPMPAALAKLGPMPAERVLGDAARGFTLEVDDAELVGSTNDLAIETRRADGSLGAVYRVGAGLHLTRRSSRGRPRGSTIDESAIVATIAKLNREYRNVTRTSIAGASGLDRHAVGRWFRADPTRWARLVTK